jgi:hypothetical protein
MARFRLKDKHYLNVPGTEWEQSETSQATGKQARKRYKTPLYLDPDQAADQNYPGEIIVTTKADPRYPRDILFEGLPTVDMEPLDEEATKLITPILARGEHPIESLSGTFSEHLLSQFESQIMEKIKSPSVEPRIAALQKQIDELKALVGAKKVA